MKILRYEDASGNVCLGEALEDGRVVALEGELFGEVTRTDRTVEVKRYLSPIAPTQVMAIGLNYRLHAKEMGSPLPEFPVLFMKNVTAACGHGESVVIPKNGYSTQVDYEAELAVVIGNDCEDVSEEEALEYVFGYTCGNDVSARDWQKQWGGGQWGRAKSFKTFCPLGPWIVTKDEIANPNALAIRSRLNGEVMQEANTDDMIFTVPQLVSFLSRSAVLAAGTVILTGTPSGVGMGRDPQVWMKSGDRIEIEIEGIGTLSNPVI